MVGEIVEKSAPAQSRVIVRLPPKSNAESRLGSAEKSRQGREGVVRPKNLCEGEGVGTRDRARPILLQGCPRDPPIPGRQRLDSRKKGESPVLCHRPSRQCGVLQWHTETAAARASGKLSARCYESVSAGSHALVYSFSRGGEKKPERMGRTRLSGPSIC